MIPRRLAIASRRGPSNPSTNYYRPLDLVASLSALRSARPSTLLSTPRLPSSAATQVTQPAKIRTVYFGPVLPLLDHFLDTIPANLGALLAYWGLHSSFPLLSVSNSSLLETSLACVVVRPFVSFVDRRQTTTKE